MSLAYLSLSGGMRLRASTPFLTKFEDGHHGGKAMVMAMALVDEEEGHKNRPLAHRGVQVYGILYGVYKILGMIFTWFNPT
ncbi:hypothetical protein MUCCIDRAFT_154956 [Mucor lusitanicus CBS 277.49]|uniref:Uncharacterized protein n=2 Tax=Mucor lusitanicus CBS 277.49 TaxID=747725 RepID=A0A162R5R1_MUCCL|nr:hypothetical protein MUCCIDRAFT_154956 [Mucor lusitanicus CBS 277.49]